MDVVVLRYRWGVDRDTLLTPSIPLPSLKGGKGEDPEGPAARWM